MATSLIGSLFAGVPGQIFSNLGQRLFGGQETESSTQSPQEARQAREQDAFYGTTSTETSNSGNNPPSTAGNNMMMASTGGNFSLLPQAQASALSYFPSALQTAGRILSSPSGQGALGGLAGGLVGGAIQDESSFQSREVMSGVTGSPNDAFMTPIGVIRFSSKGNVIITRKMKSRLKSLADQVGLEQAVRIAEIPLQLGAMILTKTFPSRERGVTGRELRQARKVVNKMKSFYAMIPTRTTSGRRMTTVARGVTQIKN
jgi:hypothetical protein